MTHRLRWRELLAALAREPHPDVRELVAEVARLRAGESEQPPAEGDQPTPAEWIRMWNEATAERRLKWAGQILASGEQASSCFLLDHEGRMQGLAEAHAAIARVRALHSREVHPGGTSYCLECCDGVIYPWPCDTIRALDREGA